MYRDKQKQTSPQYRSFHEKLMRHSNSLDGHEPGEAANTPDLNQLVLFTRSELEYALEQEDLPAWAGVVFRDFAQSMLSKERPFPCTFGVESFLSDGLRYVFIDSAHEEGCLQLIKDSLAHYIQISRSIHRYTSMVIFFKPCAEPRTIDEYRADFWNVLQYLNKHDPQAWPQEVPTDPEEPTWEFCFAGEPIFVVCNTPAHVHRHSRYARSMVITFQPRWVFDDLMANPRKAERARAVIRARLEKYDALPIAQSLGVYGDSSNREWKQYFLPDVELDDPALDATARCPFKISGNISAGSDNNEVVHRRVAHVDQHSATPADVEQACGGDS